MNQELIQIFKNRLYGLLEYKESLEKDMNEELEMEYSRTLGKIQELKDVLYIISIKGIDINNISHEEFKKQKKAIKNNIYKKGDDK